MEISEDLFPIDITDNGKDNSVWREELLILGRQILSLETKYLLFFPRGMETVGVVAEKVLVEEAEDLVADLLFAIFNPDKNLLSLFLQIFLGKGGVKQNFKEYLEPSPYLLAGEDPC